MGQLGWRSGMGGVGRQKVGCVGALARDRGAGGADV